MVGRGNPFPGLDTVFAGQCSTRFGVVGRMDWLESPGFRPGLLGFGVKEVFGWVGDLRSHLNLLAWNETNYHGCPPRLLKIS